MKYKIYIDGEAVAYLNEWGSDRRKYVLDCPPLSKRFEVYFSDSKHEHMMFFEHKHYGYKFTFAEKSSPHIKGKIVRTPDGDNDYKIDYDLNPEKLAEGVSVESVGELLRRCCAVFLLSVSYLMYGNILGEKEYIAAGRNEGENKIIVFRKFKDRVYAVSVNHHRSPDGIFEVRGHFRHYKSSGKVVWIDSYIKGREENHPEE